MSTTAFLAMGLLNMVAAVDMWRIGNPALAVVFACYGVACVAYIWGAR